MTLNCWSLFERGVPVGRRTFQRESKAKSCVGRSRLVRKLLVKLISHEASHSVFMRMVVVNGCKVGNIRVFSCVFCKFSVFNSAHRHKSHDNVVTKEHSLSFPPVLVRSCPPHYALLPGFRDLEQLCSISVVFFLVALRCFLGLISVEAMARRAPSA